MTITQIECFVEAARTGSFGKAGAKLYISQQTISRQIKALETELGFPLFIRSKSGVMLTESGAVMYEKWKQLLVENRSAIDQARDLYGGANKKIKVGIVECGNQKRVVVDGLIRFNEKYPDLEIEYEIYPLRELLNAMEDGSVHIGICLSIDVKDNSNIKRFKMKHYQEQTGYVFSKQHPLAKRKNISLQQMAKEVIGVVSRTETEDHYRNVKEYFSRNGIQEDVQIKEYSTPRNLQMALATGKCVSIMFDYIMDGVEDRLEFRPVSVDWADHGMSVICIDERYAIKAKNIAEEYV